MLYKHKYCTLSSARVLNFTGLSLHSSGFDIYPSHSIQHFLTLTCVGFLPVMFYSSNGNTPYLVCFLLIRVGKKRIFFSVNLFCYIFMKYKSK